MYETIKYEKTGPVVTITLNRPERLNALNFVMSRELSQAWISFKDDDEALVAIVTGQGARAFCAGADLKERAEQGVEKDREAYRPGAHKVLKPIIAAVNGLACGGGLNIVVESDIVIAVEEATFFDPHVNTVGWPGPAAITLPQRMPYQSAMRVLLMGTKERMSARRAYELGLVTEIVAADRLIPRARELAEIIAGHRWLAVRGVKEVAEEAIVNPGGAEALLAHYMEICKKAKDAMEGVRAFDMKKQPGWNKE